MCGVEWVREREGATFYVVLGEMAGFVVWLRHLTVASEAIAE